MLDVKSVDEVFRIIHENFYGFKLEDEAVNIKDAVGRITAHAVAAAEDIPGFNRSAVDGYAVMAADTFGCGESLPAQLRLVGEVKMGEKPDFALTIGVTVYTPTGGELPESSDAVVMLEYAENMDDGYVYLYKPVAPGNNVVFRGDDLKTGDLVINANHRLKSQDIGVLAALGIEEVAVKRKVKVGIVATGDEVIAISKKPTGSQVRDANSYSLYAGLMDHGVTPVLYGIVNDSYEKLREVAQNALRECDLVLISGGSSVGARDETYKVIDSMDNAKMLVHGIAVKPGKPTIMGKVGLKAVIGLPGHPASAFFIFKLFVTRLLDEMNGITGKPAASVKATMTVNYPSNNGREEYIPVILRDVAGEIQAEPVFGKSGLLKMLVTADGYVRIGRGSEGINKGSTVEVILF